MIPANRPASIPGVRETNRNGPVEPLWQIRVDELRSLRAVTRNMSGWERSRTMACGSDAETSFERLKAPRRRDRSGAASRAQLARDQIRGQGGAVVQQHVLLQVERQGDPFVLPGPGRSEARRHPSVRLCC